MQFVGPKGKQVRLGRNKVAKFTLGTYSTDIESEIEMLKNAKGVSAVEVEAEAEFSIDEALAIENKDDLDVYAAKFGYELDKRKSLENMLLQLEELTAK